MDTLQQNLNSFLEKWKKMWKEFLEGLQKQGKDGKKINISFWINKQSYYVALSILIVMMITFCVWLGIIWYKNNQLTLRTWDLKQLSEYNMVWFQQSDIMNDEKDSLPKTVAELIRMYQDAEARKKELAENLDFKKSVYTDFLKNLLLPSLNIWKDPYTKEIDLSILGKKYLDQNPYQDISLLSQWSSIVKDSGKDVGDNEVVNMKIGEIEELENGFFRIPMNIAFKSDSKRAFLLLVDKLSLTSNINNLWLLNDFTFYLFDVIRAQKPEQIRQLMEEYNITPSGQDEKTYNAVISRYLYSWIFTGDTVPNILIDEKVIDTAIKESIVCRGDQSDDVCYFMFRNKYRNIPGLAYAIGLEGLVNKPLALKRFYAEIPPLIAIDSFTFDKAKSQGLSLANTNEYLWNINFSIYGRGIDPADAEEISSQLTANCFASGSKNTLDLSWALNQVQASILQIENKGNAAGKIWNGNADDSLISRMWNLIELKTTLQEDMDTYETLSPYNKIIKKFEYFRMLRNVGLCSASNH